jgi:hypothetical protein
MTQTHRRRLTAQARKRRVRAPGRRSALSPAAAGLLFVHADACRPVAHHALRATSQVGDAVEVLHQGEWGAATVTARGADKVAVRVNRDRAKLTLPLRPYPGANIRECLELTRV